MKCHVCGSKLAPLVTDLPFKVSEKTIVILKDLLYCSATIAVSTSWRIP